MDLLRLIEALVDPASYSHPVGVVDVHQTHISVVFLAGPYAYKVKKPLRLDFLDYSTLERRHHFCEEEVRLNRRLARAVYLGVVPVVRDGPALRVDGPGEVIEWAVKMMRLPEEATFGERLRRDEVGIQQVEALAARIAEFHATAEAGPHIAAAGRFDVVAGNARENFTQSEATVGTAVSRPVLERLRGLTEDALIRLRPIIERRAARGVPRDTHGDLRLGHVYLFPDRMPPDDLIIVDCIEFDERFRHADPVADIAFLMMDFIRNRRRDLGSCFADAYFRLVRDEEGWSLLPFYTAYRAAVRGKVEGIKHTEAEIPNDQRVAALDKARACWLLALGELEDPSRRPCVILTGGLPGAGKSTLARSLADRAGFTVVRSDLVRKELVGRNGGDPAPAEYAQGNYSPEWIERTYSECARRTEALLFDGKRVLVDATFGKETHRNVFLELAARWSVPAILLICRADVDIIQARLRERKRDASDADWEVYLKAASHWEEPAPATQRLTRTIDTGADGDRATSLAIDVLRDLGLETER